MVDARDLKSLDQKSCGFDSRPAHQNWEKIGIAARQRRFFFGCAERKPNVFQGGRNFWGSRRLRLFAAMGGLCYTQDMTQQSFDDAINDIRKTVSRFQKIEGKPWGVEGAVIELAKQVGQLSALVMNREGYYFSDREKLDQKQYTATDDKIADELADIMFAVVRIADHYGIDLVATNIKTRQDEDEFLKTKGV